VNLPNRVPSMPREQYVNDSAHHGLSMDQKGSTLCAAGTMDDYAALVDRRTMTPRIFDTASTGHSYGKPYWTTEGLGDTCWVSLSEADAVAVLSFDQRKELAYLPVGDHPQRIRHGFVSERVLAAPAPAGTATAAATAASALDAGSRLGPIDDSPAPRVTSAQEVDLQLVGSRSVPWLTVVGLLALLLVSTALRSAQARMTRRRA
ncbi:MAG: serine/threonine protein kinase, partial [Marmoricola sp.]|nr:serine/threonine protein kinase [Marmoricola sp.]